MAGTGTAMDVKMATAVAGGVSNVAAFCRELRISRQTFYKWRRRFGDGGVDGLNERSRRPLASPNATDEWVEDEIVYWRKWLADDGDDNGPEAIRWRLLRDPDIDDAVVPSRATIWRVLVRRGLVTPEPKKRPKSSLQRFVYARPNECWQSDWTGWFLGDSSPVAISGTLDDHSRYCAGLRAEPGDGSAEGVWQTMLAAIAECGIPQRSLTDNGLCYSGYRRGKAVAFEVNLRALGVVTICSSPYHPQTCGKIERFWQTLKKWLRKRPAPRTITQLQALLDEFRAYYNTRRPHRALAGATPAEAFTATAKARPAKRPLPAPVTASTATVHAGKVNSGTATICVGARWSGHHVSVIRDGTHVAIFSGQLLIRELDIDPSRRYQPAEQARYDLRGQREPLPATRPSGSIRHRWDSRLQRA
jgi:transposase InsO family protein